MPNKPKQIILAIESSCDETAAAVLIDGQIASNIIASQADLHAKYGGVVPEVAARSHITAIIPTIDRALKNAKVKLSNINAIAVTHGPGLATSLMVGVDTAKALSEVLNIPLYPINHMEAHIYSNFTYHMSHITYHHFPALILVVSGGHTMLVIMKKHGDYKIVGETVDDAAGEAFDKSAKLLGLGYPGGPILSKIAKTGNPKSFAFPRPMINSNNLNFSFSGLKTAVLYKIMEQKTWNRKQKADIAASVQQAIVNVLINKTQKAIAKYQPKTIMLGGGVAANQLLRKEFKKLAKKNKLQISIPEPKYCSDNAAMIGLAAHFRIKYNHTKPNQSFNIDPNLSF